MKHTSRVKVFVTQLEAGGAQFAAIKLTKGLLSAGFDAKLYFLYKKSGVSDISIDYKIISTLKPKIPLFFPILCLKLLILLLKEKPRTTIAFTHYANVIVLPLALISGVKNRIASQRNPAWSYPILARILDPMWGSLGVYTRNVMVSRAVLKSFVKRPKRYLSKTIVIPNGFDPSNQKELTHEQVGILEGIGRKYKTIITVGRLATQKNQEILIQALTYLPEVYLVVLGKGEKKRQLEEKALKLKVASRIRFLDFIPNTEIISFLSRFDLIAFPSIFEGMSNVLIESLFCGVPIVASSIEENKAVLEIKENVYCGLLANPRDVKDWVEKINLVLSDPERAKSISYLALQRSKSFTVDQMVIAFSRIINER